MLKVINFDTLEDGRFVAYSYLNELELVGFGKSKTTALNNLLKDVQSKISELNTLHDLIIDERCQEDV